ESLAVYFLHMTVGHHGIFSLTPMLIFAAWGCSHMLRRGNYAGLVLAILFLTAVVFAFFWIVNNQRNYGGHCHGLRWLMWLAPLWLLFLPAGLTAIRDRAWGRGLAVAALAVSVF